VNPTVAGCTTDCAASTVKSLQKKFSCDLFTSMLSNSMLKNFDDTQTISQADGMMMCCPDYPGNASADDGWAPIWQNLYDCQAPTICAFDQICSYDSTQDTSNGGVCKQVDPLPAGNSSTNFAPTAAQIGTPIPNPVCTGRYLRKWIDANSNLKLVAHHGAPAGPGTVGIDDATGKWRWADGTDVYPNFCCPQKPCTIGGVASTHSEQCDDTRPAKDVSMDTPGSTSGTFLWPDEYALVCGSDYINQDDSWGLGPSAMNGSGVDVSYPDCLPDYNTWMSPTNWGNLCGANCANKIGFCYTDSTKAALKTGNRCGNNGTLSCKTQANCTATFSGACKGTNSNCSGHGTETPCLATSTENCVWNVAGTGVWVAGRAASTTVAAEGCCNPLGDGCNWYGRRRMASGMSKEEQIESQLANLSNAKTLAEMRADVRVETPANELRRRLPEVGEPGVGGAAITGKWCFEVIETSIKDNWKKIAGVGFVTICYEAFGCIFACIVARAIKKSKKDMKKAARQSLAAQGPGRGDN